jgi:uncharacterized membrane protein YfcA
MLSDPWFYAVAIPAMIILGVSKGGFTTIGMLTVPILSLVISPVQAAAIVLPILVLSDLVAVISYRGIWDGPTLRIVLPGAVIGILLGWLTAAWVTEREIRLLVGAMSVLFALNYWLRRGAPEATRGQDPLKGGFWGAVSGYTSFVSHAGGPPFQIYVAPLRLEPILFAGTSVITFALMNAVKLVPYFFLGQFSTANLLASAILLPVSIPATLAGVWLVKRIEPGPFYRLAYALIFFVGLYLVFEALFIG